jgi:hypothetical protein
LELQYRYRRLVRAALGDDAPAVPLAPLDAEREYRVRHQRLVEEHAKAMRRREEDPEWEGSPASTAPRVPE